MGFIYPSANQEISDLKHRFIERGMEYFEEEAINTNGNTWGEHFKENEYLKQKTANTRLSN